MISSVYYVVVYTSQGVPASVYKRIFCNFATANSFAKRSLISDRKQVYNTISFDGYFIHQFSLSVLNNLDSLPF